MTPCTLPTAIAVFSAIDTAVIQPLFPRMTVEVEKKGTGVRRWEGGEEVVVYGRDSHPFPLLIPIFSNEQLFIFYKHACT